jgi:CRP-like cAMP-binding protein
MADEERTGNAILDALSDDRHEAVLGSARIVNLERGHIVFDVGDEITEVHFPIDAVVSVVVVVESGASVEAAMVGREGFVGVPVFLGRRSPAPARAIVQIPGRSVMLSADAFEAQLADDGKLTDLLRSYTMALMTQMEQGVACNRLHEAEERLARWLCQAHDTARGDYLPLTQEFIAEMLGVRRATVTVAARTLQDDDIIDYRRGRITVLDRERLEATACECYEVIRREHRGVTI